jgi:thioredoxin
MIFLGIFDNIFKNSTKKQKSTDVIDWPKYVVTLDEKSFDNFIQNYPISVVDFWASWCAPCKAMAPRIRQVSYMYQGKVAFGKLDTQECQGIAKKYKIMSIPQLIFFCYGKKVATLTGVQSVGSIKDVIEDLIKKRNS